MFFKKTIDGIISDITKRIKHLEDVAAAHLKDATKHAAIEVAASDAGRAAVNEADRATRLAAKFTALVS